MESGGHDDDQLPYAKNHAPTDGGVIHRREMASNVRGSNRKAISHVVVWRCDAAVPWNKCFQLNSPRSLVTVVRVQELQQRTEERIQLRASCRLAREVQSNISVHPIMNN